MRGFWRKLQRSSASKVDPSNAPASTKPRWSSEDRETVNSALDLLRSIAGNSSESKEILHRLSDRIANTNTNPDRAAQRGRKDEKGIFYFDPDGVVSSVIVNPSIASGKLAKEILRLMSPADVVGGRFIRVGNDYDGGYVMLDHALSDTACYSFGINDDVSWDQGMVDRGCHIYQFDHTIAKLPYERDEFHWSKLGIGASTGGEFISVRDIIARNEHENRNNIILKMDIEGAEWDVFETISSDDLGKFSQIVVELHSFVTGGDEHLTRAATILEKVNQTHQSIHFHANNWSWLGILGGVSLPDVFELTYVRKTDHKFAPCTREFPTPLDRACREGAPDYFLRF